VTRQIHGFELGCDYDIIHHKGGYWNCRSNMSLSSCLLVTLMKQHLDVCTYNVGTQQRRQRIATYDIAIHNRYTYRRYLLSYHVGTMIV